MKKIATLVIMVALAGVSFADGLNLKPLALRDFSNGEWRAGVAWNFYSKNDGVLTPQMFFASNPSNWERPYLGAALSAKVATWRDIQINGVVGYSVNVSNLKSLGGGRWGYGAELEFKF